MKTEPVEVGLVDKLVDRIDELVEQNQELEKNNEILQKENESLREHARAKYPDLWQAFLALKDHPKDECPTYYDGCNCTVETLKHNIERAERAEKKLKFYNVDWKLVKEGESFFLCTCRGDGNGGHSVGCFDNPMNHCPDCNSYMFEPDGKTKLEKCPDTFKKCRIK